MAVGDVVLLVGLLLGLAATMNWFLPDGWVCEGSGGGDVEDGAKGMGGAVRSLFD